MFPRTHEMPVSVYRALLTQAYVCAPNECCGFLVKIGADRFPVVRSARNVSDLPEDRFTMDPGMVKATLEQEKEGTLKIVAMYHSHVSVAPVPSGRDKSGWVPPGIDYLIIGLGGDVPVVRAWDMGGMSPKEIGFKVTANIW